MSSTTYKIQQGDTFELIARKQYGDELQAWRIAQANPGVFEPPIAGTVITIPAQQDVVTDTLQVDELGENEVWMFIDGHEFKFWTELKIKDQMDKFATASFISPFDSNDDFLRETFRPFSFKSVTIGIGGQVRFTGVMVDVAPSVSANSKTVSVSCYSLPGVLNDCNMPASSFPLEFNNQYLFDIASTLCAPFGINFIFETIFPELQPTQDLAGRDFLAPTFFQPVIDQGAQFEQVSCDPSKKVFAFLADLARQRGLIMSSKPDGSLFFQRSVLTGNPLAVFRQGESPLVGIEPRFNPQQFYSHITGLESVSIGTDGSQFTVKNDYLDGVVRPMNFKVNDTKGGDVKSAVEAKSGRMYANAVSYSAQVATWRDPSGKLWESNTTIKVGAPDAMIYNEYEFVVRSVEFNKGESETATLELILPGSFDGRIPEALPWQDS